MLVVLNPRAGSGTAARRWARIEPGLRSLAGDFDVLVLEAGVDLSAQIKATADRGETEYAAAGGDGTVNALAVALLALERPNVRLGAIALGSSNDYHKPVRQTIDGVPVRIDFEAAVCRDVLCIVGDGAAPRMALVTASMGVTAEANRFFNDPSPTLARLKTLAPNLAVSWAAASTIARFRPEPLRIDHGEAEKVANLAVLLTPFCAGVLSYDAALAPVPGHATIAVCADMTRAELARVVSSLARGRFSGLAKTRSWQTTRLVIDAPRPVAVEADGEVITSSHVEFRVLRNALICCP